MIFLLICKNNLAIRLKLFNKDLNNFEAIDNQTIHTISWFNFDNLILDIRQQLWDIFTQLDEEFKQEHYYKFYKLDRFISVLGMDWCDLKLNELDQYYDKLSKENKTKYDEFKEQKELSETIIMGFLGYCSEVEVIDKNKTLDAKIHEEAILSTLSSQILDYTIKQINLYDEEGFLVDEYDDSKKKIN